MELNKTFVYFCSFFSRMQNKMVDFCYKKFMLGFRFNFKAYTKNLREKVTKYSLKGSIRCWWTCAYQILPNSLRLAVIQKKKRFTWCPVWSSFYPTWHRFYRTVCLDLKKNHRFTILVLVLILSVFQLLHKNKKKCFP